MVIHESAENYLESILVIQERKGNVRSIDIVNELNKIAFSNADMVSDVYGGVTNNKLNGNGYHDGYYWYDANGNIAYDPPRQSLEAWAEFFSAKITGNTTNITYNEQYFPTATALLEEYAGELLEDYTDYYFDLYHIER